MAIVVEGILAQLATLVRIWLFTKKIIIRGIKSLRQGEDAGGGIDEVATE